MSIRPTRRRGATPAPTPLRELGLLAMLKLLALLALFLLAGCAGRAPVGDEPHVDDKDDRPLDQPVCLVVEGDPEALPDAEDSVWWREGGSMRCVVVDDTLSASRDAAVASAAGRLLPGAFEMLERRGAALTPLRREETNDEFAEAVTRGEGAGFPRISIRETVVERCGDADGVEHWRARLLAEYPIGVIRGDATHARWAERRIARELKIRVQSADDLFAKGRWLDGAAETRRAYDLLPRLSRDAMPENLGSERVSELRSRSGALAPRFERLDGTGKLVLSAGSRETVRFRLSYLFGGDWVPAAGVPVTTVGGGMVRTLVGATETDESGEIEIEFVAGSETGEDSFDVVAAVPPGQEVFIPGDRSAAENAVIATTTQEVFVLPLSNATVCVEIDAGNDADQERTREGLLAGLTLAGSRLVECGPDASLVVTVDVSMSTQETHGTWLAHAECDVRVFDQRLAEDVGGFSFEVMESLESSARDAEVLVLREVGRLIAVYLEPRLAER